MIINCLIERRMDSVYEEINLLNKLYFLDI